MAYDEILANRVRSVLKGKSGISEKKMFGGLCLLSDEKMVCGIRQNEIMLRVGPEGGRLLLKEKGIRPMDFTGKPMEGFLYASRAKIEDDAELGRLVGIALDYVATVPKKKKKAGGKKGLPLAKKTAGVKIKNKTVLAKKKSAKKAGSAASKQSTGKKKKKR